MKNNYSPILLLGAAGGLVCWSIYELFLFITTPLLPGILPLSLFAGGFLGALLGGFIGGHQGYLKHSLKRLKKNAMVGGIAGLVAGLVSSYLIFYIDTNFVLTLAGCNIKEFFPVIRWVTIALFIGASLGIAEAINIEISREILAAFVTGISCSFVIIIISGKGLGPFIERGVTSVSFCTLYAYFLFRFSTLKRKEWIKSLNGQLAGLEFELSKDSHYFGTQACDDINLSSYEKVNPAHAKLIKYYTGYSLTDNDPFGLTYVNFRSIKEQPLKNGDILKIGSALFQYCRNDI